MAWRILQGGCLKAERMFKSHTGKMFFSKESWRTYTQRIKVPCFIRWVTVHSKASDLKVLLFPQPESKPQDCVYHLPEASWYRNLNSNTLIQMWREIISRDKKMRVGDGQVGWLSQLVHPHVVEKRRGLYMCAWPLHPNDTAHLFIYHILTYIQMPDIDLSIFKY